MLALESRRAREIALLLENQGAVPCVAPSMREAPIEFNEPVFAWAGRLFAGEFDMMVLLTGVGTRALDNLLAARFPPEAFRDALRRLTVVARGPKPVAALREMGLQPTITVPEPNTWRELLEATAGRPERRIAVQEYGKPNPDLLAGLRARGAEVSTVRVYSWALPEDLGPLRQAVHRLAAREFDFIVFTTSVQVDHLHQIAAEEGAAIADVLGSHTVVVSIGPTCSERLADYGIATDFAPSHPKMGFLVKETADRASGLIQSKRRGVSP